MFREGEPPELARLDRQKRRRMSLEKRRTYSTLDLNCRCCRLFSESYEQRIDRDSHFNLRGRNLQHSRFGWVSEAGHVTRFCAGKILDY